MKGKESDNRTPDEVLYDDLTVTIRHNVTTFIHASSLIEKIKSGGRPEDGKYFDDYYVARSLAKNTIYQIQTNCPEPYQQIVRELFGKPQRKG